LDKTSKNIFDPVAKYHEATPDKVLLIKQKKQDKIYKSNLQIAYDQISDLQAKMQTMQKQFDKNIKKLKDEHTDLVHEYDLKYRKYILMNNNNQNIKVEDEKMKLIIRKELDESKN